MLNDTNLKDYVISIGCNYNGSLSGCINDSILMYNTFSKMNKECYLLNDKSNIITSEKIKEIVKKIHNLPKSSRYRIIFTFAGHGYAGGKIQLSNEIISYNELYDILNYESQELFKLIIILDSCYSGGFVNLKSYKNIFDISIITSCNSSQKSSESLSDKLINKVGILEYITIDDCYYIGVFTYNFTDIIDNLLNLNKEITIDSIFSEKIWSIISYIANQTYQIK
jgi:hypothetical protein